jgi:L-iditol 2-dehydrogenase
MTIRAAVMPGPNLAIELRDLPEPRIEPGGVLLDVVLSEVCGTDVHLHHGRLAGVPYPIIPGHVSVGRVLEAPGLATDALLEPCGAGDLVTFYDVHGTCGTCYACAVARTPNRCPSRRVYGITMSAYEGPFGGWAERIYLRPGTQLLKIQPPLTAQDVIAGGCGLFTGFASVERSGLAIGSSVVVQGSGPVGLCAAAVSRLRGCDLLVVIGDPEARLALASGLGADVILSLASTSVNQRLAAVRELTGGRGADVVIEASGNPSAVPEGLDLLRDGGTYVIAGHYTDAGPVSVNPHVINRKHAAVLGQWGTSFSHVTGALRMLARHRERLRLTRLIGRAYPLERAGEALADVERLRVTKAVIGVAEG